MDELTWISMVADLRIVSARFEVTLEYLRENHPNRADLIDKSLDSKHKIDEALVTINQIERLQKILEKEVYELSSERITLKYRVQQLEEINERLLKDATL